MSRAPFPLLAGLAVLSLSGSCRPVNGQDGVDASDSPRNVERIVRCREAQQAGVEERRRALQASQTRLAAALENGSADPVRDARAAAARGDFRLVRALTMGGTYPFGLECRSPVSNSNDPPMTLAVRFYSDVLGSCETAGGTNACALEAAMDRYAPVYNRTLAADPLYPHADICRPLDDRQPRQPRHLYDPVDFGFPDLVPTDRPHDLHEAARRGTAAALASLLASGRGAIDAADPWGLSPLAWAVIRHRSDAAAQLLAAGADPLGPGCQVDAAESPLRLALQTGQEALARAMLTPAVRARLTPWPTGLLRAAAQGGLASLLQTMLQERHAYVRRQDLERREGPPLSAPVLAVLDAQRSSLCLRGPLPRNAVATMIGVYESSDRIDFPYGNQPGRITVRIPATDRPLILVASAYEPVEWRIVRAPGARLVAIYALGYYMPRVTGDLGGVGFVTNDMRERCERLHYRGSAPYQPGDDQRALAAAAETMLGVPVRGFQGSYSAAGFTLDPTQLRANSPSAPPRARE